MGFSDHHMKTYLKTIKGRLPFSPTPIEIKFANKVLIITGKMGSGKTQLLRFIHDRIEAASSAKELKALPRLLSHLESIRSVGRDYIKDTPEYHDWLVKLRLVEEQLDQLTRELSLDIAKKNTPHPTNKPGRFLRLYEAGRVADILEAPAGDTLLGDQSGQFGNPFTDQSKYLERYLVQRKQRQLLKLQDGDPATADKLWFEEFELQLRELWSEPLLNLVYDNTKGAFFLQLPQRPPFRLQDFSRGSLALFAIYADLLMRAAALDQTSQEFKGIVLIDELDAHLDVNLQRKILPFLERYFPQVQFIVTTNSPLVVMSVSDAVVYDVGRNKAFTHDFSLYSFEAVATEVFNTSFGSSLRVAVDQ